MKLFDKCMKHERFISCGESRIEKVGKDTVLVSRDKHNDINGNGVYRAKVMLPDGSFSKAYRTNNSYATAIWKALRNEKGGK